jgi:hypothetical protein
MSLISGPVCLDFIRTSNRSFYLFGDVHFSTDLMCPDLTFIDTLEEFSEIGKKFDFYTEARFDPSDAYGEDRSKEPLISAEIFCLSGRCLPNIRSHRVDIRRGKTSLLRFIRNLRKRYTHEILDALGNGKLAEYILTKFLERNYQDDSAKVFIESVAELCENFPEKFAIAIDVIEKSLLRNRETIEKIGSSRAVGEIQEILVLMISIFMDLNFISRFEHYNKDGTSPTNIIYYAGDEHIVRLIEYLYALNDIEEHIRYGKRGSVDNPLRCMKLDRKLADL